MSKNPILNRKHQKDWYVRNKEVKIDLRHEQRRKIKEFIDNLKSVPCMDCGNTFPAVCMDFDHVRGSKIFNISSAWIYSFDKILEEIEKCEIVCANCHRIRTSRRSSME